MKVHAKRQQKHSTSNPSCVEWGSVFGDDVAAVTDTILDRVHDYSTTLNIRCEWHRLKHKKRAGDFPVAFEIVER